MNSVKSHLKSPSGETWKSALARFERLCHLNLDEYIDEESGENIVINLSSYYDDGTLFEVTNKEPVENIKTYEMKYGITIPPELATLMCDHGAFAIYMVSLRLARRWGDRTFLEIYGSKDTNLFPNIKPLCRAITFNFGDYFADSELTEEQIRRLDSH